MVKRFCFIFCVLCFAIENSYAELLATSPYGMVSSQESLATDVGVRILEKGGNAIDAAVAMGFALAVSYPQAGNLAGGGFMMIHHAGRHETKIIDYRETAPKATSENLFVNQDQSVNLFRKRHSLKSSGVPGTVKGLETAWSIYGSLPWEDLLNPSIYLAEKGFNVYPHLENMLHKHQKKLKKDKEVKRLFFKNFLPLKKGDRLVQKDLAQVLKKIQKEKSKGFYEGSVADKLVLFMKQRKGLITHEDLENYEVVLRDPLFLDIEGYRLAAMPPPSSGGVAIIQSLQILKELDIKSVLPESETYYHLLAETLKRTFADRAHFLGDPDFERVPIKDLTSPLYARRLAKGISMHQAMPSRFIYPGQGLPHRESLETTHFTVMDKWGNVVTNTYTLNHPFGNGRIIPGTGMFLNNEMDDFTAKKGSANAFGLKGGDKNLPQAQKRPLSSMSPSILLKENEAVLATGAPGGPRIISAVTHVLAQRIFFNKSLYDATVSPRIHHQWSPDVLYVEKTLPDSIQKALKKRGHHLKERLNLAHVFSVEKKKNVYHGVADPRTTSSSAKGVCLGSNCID